MLIAGNLASLFDACSPPATAAAGAAATWGSPRRSSFAMGDSPQRSRAPTRITPSTSRSTLRSSPTITGSPLSQDRGGTGEAPTSTITLRPPGATSTRCAPCCPARFAGSRRGHQGRRPAPWHRRHGDRRIAAESSGSCDVLRFQPRAGTGSSRPEFCATRETDGIPGTKAGGRTQRSTKGLPANPRRQPVTATPSARPGHRFAGATSRFRFSACSRASWVSL